jgi:ribonuclease HI
VDGGARGNPGPAGFGVVVDDERGKRLAELSEYLGHQTNNVAEYRGLLAALDYVLEHGLKGLKVISDSELLVRQMKGIYKVKNAALQDLYRLAQERIAKLDWFSIEHVLREGNREADQLANEAMDRGRRTGSSPMSSVPREYNGIVQGGVVHLLGGELPEGTMVKVKVKG